MHDFFFFENLRNPARGHRAGLMRQFCPSQVYSTKFSIIWRGMRGMMRGTPRALPCFFVNLRNVYVMRAKLRHILCKGQGIAVVCFSQRWVNTNFGIIYNTLHVCTRLWLRYCACEKILQKYRSPKRRLYIRNRSIEHWIWLFWDVFLRIFKIRDLYHRRYSS